MKPTRNEILEVLKEIKVSLAARGIEKIGLFGSYATGRQNAYSDIDIAFGKRADYRKHFSGYDYFDMLRFLRDTLQKRLHRPVDLFDLDSQSPLRSRIQRELIDV
ncbi:nucleotidyltransferase family protein [Hydrogenimonas sp.]